MSIINSNLNKTRYINKDFNSIKDNLKEFIKIYYPQTYKDFSPSSPGMMFVDLISYVGDVLSYYTDDSFKESLLSTAEKDENILNIAQSWGYIPKLSSVSTTSLDIFMVIPSKHNSTGSGVSPDWDYALTIMPGLEIKPSLSNISDIVFRVDDYIIFNENDPNIDVQIYDYDSLGIPQHFILKKTVYAHSAVIGEENIVTPISPQKYYKIQINKENIIGILSVTDSEGNKWYETPYLAQNMVFENIINNTDTKIISPYILKLKQVDRRFITRINKNRRLELQFGSGISASPDEYMVPNPDNINNLSMKDLSSYLDTPLDPSNFMYTKTYGQVPYNTTLNIKYIYGGGIKSNIGSNVINKISNIEYEETFDNLNSSLIDEVKKSIAINNPEAATGGGSGETIEEIRYNTMAYFSSQLRAVNREDYIIRTYSLPPKFGRIAKAHILKNSELLYNKGENIDNNPLALNLYVLGYDNNNNLTKLNNITKTNLKTYLDYYRLITDAINIMDAYIINIGINFEIVVNSQYNKNKVLLNCLESIKKMFNIQDWQINQPIVLSDIYNLLFEIEGVRNVIKVDIVNKFNIDEGYSGNIYDIKSSIIDGVLYPSLDPSCFEIKYSNRDIVGTAK